MALSLQSKTLGSGRPLVLLHGFPLSHQMWRDLVPPKGFRLILTDFPGFGSSPLTHEKIDFKALSEALWAHLRGLGLDGKISLGGISMGGYWAFEFARLYPDQLDQLLLISTRAGLDKPEGRQNRLTMADRVEKEGMGPFVAGMVPGLLSETTLTNKPQVVQTLSQWVAAADPKAVALAQRVMAERRDQTDLLPKIQAKTLIIAGREDALIDPAQSQAMAQLIPNCELKMLERVGHLIPLEDPEGFQRLIDNLD